MNRKGDHSQDKWGAINNAMKRRRMAVLGLQETHPSNELQKTIGRRFWNTLHVVHSTDPQDPGRTGGVSIVIHKGLINTKNMTHQEVIPGRVILMEIPWGGDNKLQIMNVYAPTRNTEKAVFWSRLLEIIENDENLCPDIVLGDLNLVENPEIDRLNNRRGTDPTAAREALTNLTVKLDLTDGWRRRHPTKRGYTFRGESQSRLDRIYAKEDIYQWCTEWKIEHPSFKTDHNLVSVMVTSENMPFIAKGRWAIPVGLMKNKWLKKETQRLARQLQTEVNQVTPENHPNHDPQLALKTFKTRVVTLYRGYQRTHQPKLENAIRSLRKELEHKADTPNLTVDEIQEQSKLIAERIEAFEKKRRDGARLLYNARNRLEGETMSKHWVRSARESTLCDTIQALRNPLQNPTQRETGSDKMAEMAREYHEKLLTLD